MHGLDVDVPKQLSNATVRDSNNGFSRSNAEGCWLVGIFLFFLFYEIGIWDEHH